MNCMFQQRMTTGKSKWEDWGTLLFSALSFVTQYAKKWKTLSDGHIVT